MERIEMLKTLSLLVASYMQIWDMRQFYEEVPAVNRVLLPVNGTFQSKRYSKMKWQIDNEPNKPNITEFHNYSWVAFIEKL